MALATDYSKLHLRSCRVFWSNVLQLWALLHCYGKLHNNLVWAGSKLLLSYVDNRSSGLKRCGTKLLQMSAYYKNLVPVFKKAFFKLLFWLVIAHYINIPCSLPVSFSQFSLWWYISMRFKSENSDSDSEWLFSSEPGNRMYRTELGNENICIKSQISVTLSSYLTIKTSIFTLWVSSGSQRSR